MTCKLLVSIFVLSLAYACISRYNPPDLGVKGFLVVDGHIFVEDGSCVIKLTRSQSVSDKSLPLPELDAQVSIESEFGDIYNLKFIDSSIYKIANQQFNYGEKYRLKIRTIDGKEYASDYVSTHKTPEIDSISISEGQFKSRKIQVNTHDPANMTWYYRWQFDETWEYTSVYRSFLEYDEKLDEIFYTYRNIYICWKSDNSKSILVGSSRKLNQDVIYGFQIHSLDTASKKMDRSYSILVKQYAISESEYKYWTELQKNTETTGGIFDSQPSQILGNVRCVNSDNDLVLGYFSVYSIAQHRIVRLKNQFSPDWYNVRTYCYLDSVNPSLVGSRVKYANDLIVAPTLVADKSCVDCRLFGGGDTLKPDFFK